MPTTHNPDHSSDSDSAAAASRGEPDLSGRVALVAGASRGAGRAIAVELAAAGATVVVTARTTRESPATTYQGFLDATGLPAMPGSLENTVEEISANGGTATAHRCDHSRPEEVRGLINEIDDTHGRLDVLVNNAWGGHEAFSEAAFGAPLWEQPLDQWEAMVDNGVRNQLVTVQQAAPLLIRTGGGLIAAPTFWDHGRYLAGNAVYDLAKAAINRLAYAAATELREHGVASVAVSPGFMRTELVLAHTGATEATWRDRPALTASESPHYLGRAVAALAGDPDVLDESGRVLVVADLARRYGFTDTDGTQPAAFRVTAPDDPGTPDRHQSDKGR